MNKRQGYRKAVLQKFDFNTRNATPQQLNEMYEQARLIAAAADRQVIHTGKVVKIGDGSSKPTNAERRLGRLTARLNRVGTRVMEQVRTASPQEPDLESAE